MIIMDVYRMKCKRCNMEILEDTCRCKPFIVSQPGNINGTIYGETIGESLGNLSDLVFDLNKDILVHDISSGSEDSIRLKPHILDGKTIFEVSSN